MLKPSFHVDGFSRDHLPPFDQWPELRFDLPSLNYPDRLNCAEILLDRALMEVSPDKVAILYGSESWSYARLSSEVNQVARVLVEDMEVTPGSRVLLRAGNTPAMFVSWLAVTKIGAIAVPTMPMLRARELRQVIDKARIEFALCDQNLVDDLIAAASHSPLRIVPFGSPESELDRAARAKSPDFRALPTSQDDVCLIAFTSGTTGHPKATMHFHRDVLAMCDTFAAHMLPGSREGVFCGTPPIAFTFGLGALLAFPLYFRATIGLPAESTPAALGEAIERYRATHVFTSPTGFRTLLARQGDHDLSSVNVCVSAGEHLRVETSDAWFDTTGIRIIDGIGSTEMTHIFISAVGDEIRPGSTGKPVPGYMACLLDSEGRPIEGIGTGRLGIRGPTGCRYLADERQRDYVINGWNVTGDVFRRDEDGYYWYVARADDMIVSGGYNIAGPEIEESLMLHPDVEECAVVGWPDPLRGEIVKAVVVLRKGSVGGPELIKILQDHVKTTLAPYKYPRAIEFRTELPKTSTGKLQRSSLKCEPTLHVDQISR
jgi:2-aminobenzoate-CoA ligase